MSNLKPINEITQLSKRVIRILGLNPGPYTLNGTGKERLLIDCGEGIEDYIENLKKTLQENKIKTILITHWHNDHSKGIFSILQESTLLSPDFKVFKKHFPDKDKYEKYYDIKDAQEFLVEGCTIKSIYSPGHTKDHMSFYLSEEKILFSGDNILGQGTTVFEDLKDYLESLNKYLDYPEEIKSIYPGHADVLDKPYEVIKEYIQHRLNRESQLIDILVKAKSKSPTGGCTSLEITEIIYAGYPKDVLPSAKSMVEKYLAKLLSEGKVYFVEEDKSWIWKDSIKL